MKTLQGQQLVKGIHRVIREAQLGLVLVSPYCDPSEGVADGIDAALERGGPRDRGRIVHAEGIRSRGTASDV
jgi:hypothetical protein